MEHLKKKISILLAVVTIVVVGKQLDDLYLAKKIHVNGLELFMKEKEVFALFGEEDPEDSYCMGCGPDMYYQHLGIFARLSETKEYIKNIKITNPEYDLLGIKPAQKITAAQSLLEDMGFTLIERDTSRRWYQFQKRKLSFELITDNNGFIESVQVKYQVKKDNDIIY